MAFATAAGYGNLPLGNFSPTIYSKKAQIAFRKASVVQAITNSEYFGEISDYGDTVRIIKEPQLTVAPYVRGQQINAQDLDDEEITLTIDKSNYFAFKLDDIEKKQAHIGWDAMASDNAGYQLKDAFDREVLNYMTTQIVAANTVGTVSSTQAIGFTSANITPLTLLNKFKRILDMNNVPQENRWFVADPYFWEQMQFEDSKLINSDYDHSTANILRNGKVTDGMIRGFKCYTSNNLPTAGTGPSGTTNGNGGWILAGHMSSTATAEQINKTERYRDPDSFADVVRGLHMYGRKVLRTESLVGSFYNLKAS